MSEELMLDVGQANEIKLAARRAGATNTDLKVLSEGDMFATILPVLRGQAEVKIVNFFREMERFEIQIPALPRPTLKEFQDKWPWIDSIEYDNSPTEAVTFALGTVHRPDEGSVSGKEYESRLASVSGLFGFQQLQWLVDHQDEHAAFKALLGQVYIDGPGLVVRGSGGGRCRPCLGPDGGRWGLGWGWLDGGFDSGGRVARSRT